MMLASVLALAGAAPADWRVELLPAGFEHRVSAIAFRPGGDLVLCDADDGSVWSLSGVLSGDRAQVRPKRIAAGLERPNAVCLVGERLFVLQRHELTELIDLDRDGVADTYSCLYAREFASGLAFAAGWFTTTLEGGARIRIALEDGHAEEAPPGSEHFARVTLPKDFDPFGGQSCYADNGLVRECFEEVEGVRQGCRMHFIDGACVTLGPDGALYVGGGASVAKLRSSGRVFFSLRAVHARTNGFELEFTEPLAPGCGWEPALWLAEAQKPLEIRSASVSADRKHVELEIAGLEAGTTVHLRALSPLPAGNSGWPISNPEAWYKIDRLPKDRPVALLEPPKVESNTLTEDERTSGWELLFDGKSAEKWRGYRQQELPAGWVVEDGALVCRGGSGDIVTRRGYDSFELRLEWKISEGGNSGIFFHASEDHEHVWESAPEMQILDDARHPDGKNPKTSAGSNYALHAPLPEMTRPVGCWNEARLRVIGGHVEHWLNGILVLKYELWTPEWKALVAASKFASMPGYGLNKAGHIALQDHGDRVSFRNIRIKHHLKR